jgi:thiol-disulfide isomerase/thioredoxin
MIRHCPIPLLLLAILAAPALAAPPEEETPSVDARLEALQQGIERLEKRMATLEKQVAALAEQSPQREKSAAARLSEIRRMAQMGKFDEAKKAAADFRKTFGNTNTAKQGARYLAELDVVGKEAPPKIAADPWFLGEGEVDTTAGKATLLIFWEEWCPHCRREVPRVQNLHETFAAQGLQVVGLTKLSRGVTEEKFRGFIEQQKLTYPIGKEDGELSRQFNVSGVPAAAVIKGGKVIWRGHPGYLRPEMVREWLGLPPPEPPPAPATDEG